MKKVENEEIRQSRDERKSREKKTWRQSNVVRNNSRTGINLGKWLIVGMKDKENEGQSLYKEENMMIKGAEIFPLSSLYWLKENREMIVEQ